MDVPAGFKMCPTCKTVKPLADFTKSAKVRGVIGSGMFQGGDRRPRKPHYQCRPCQNAYAKARRTRIKEA